jgi:hypothetical protein
MWAWAIAHNEIGLALAVNVMLAASRGVAIWFGFSSTQLIKYHMDNGLTLEAAAIEVDKLLDNQDLNTLLDLLLDLQENVFFLFCFRIAILCKTIKKEMMDMDGDLSIILTCASRCNSPEMQFLAVAVMAHVTSCSHWVTRVTLRLIHSSISIRLKSFYPTFSFLSLL